MQWRDAVTARVDAGQGPADLANDLVEGAQVLETAVDLVPSHLQSWLRSAVAALRDTGRPLPARLSAALEVVDLLWQFPGPPGT